MPDPQWSLWVGCFFFCLLFKWQINENKRYLLGSCNYAPSDPDCLFTLKSVINPFNIKLRLIQLGSKQRNCCVNYGSGFSLVMQFFSVSSCCYANNFIYSGRVSKSSIITLQSWWFYFCYLINAPRLCICITMEVYPVKSHAKVIAARLKTFTCLSDDWLMSKSDYSAT